MSPPSTAGTLVSLFPMYARLIDTTRPSAPTVTPSHSAKGALLSRHARCSCEELARHSSKMDRSRSAGEGSDPLRTLLSPPPRPGAPFASAPPGALSLMLMVHLPPCVVHSCSTSSVNAARSGFQARSNRVRALRYPSAASTVVSLLFRRSNRVSALRPPSSAGTLVSWLNSRRKTSSALRFPSAAGTLVSWFERRVNILSAVSPPSAAGKSPVIPQFHRSIDTTRRSASTPTPSHSDTGALSSLHPRCSCGELARHSSRMDRSRPSINASASARRASTDQRGSVSPAYPRARDGRILLATS